MILINTNTTSQATQLAPNTPDKVLELWCSESSNRLSAITGQREIVNTGSRSLIPALHTLEIMQGQSCAVSALYSLLVLN